MERLEHNGRTHFVGESEMLAAGSAWADTAQLLTSEEWSRVVSSISRLKVEHARSGARNLCR